MKRNIIDIHKLTYFLFIIDRHSHCPEYKFASEDRKENYHSDVSNICYVFFYYTYFFL